MEKKFLVIGNGSIGSRHFDLIKSFYPQKDVSHISSREFLDDYENILDRDFQFFVIAGPVIHREKTLEMIGDKSFFS